MGELLKAIPDKKATFGGGSRSLPDSISHKLSHQSQTLVYAGGKGLGLPRTTERVLSFIPCQQFPMIAYTPLLWPNFQRSHTDTIVTLRTFAKMPEKACFDIVQASRPLLNANVLTITLPGFGTFVLKLW